MRQRVAVAVLGVLVVISLVRYTRALPDPAFLDFRAFYCGAQALVQHGDPYRVEPLRTCERTPSRLRLWTSRGQVVPVPLPPLTLALFGLLLPLGFDGASLVWLVLLVASLVFAVIALARTYGVAAWRIATLFALPLAAVSFALGQLAPIVVAVIAAAAWALQRRRDALAGGALVLTLVEPHVGAAACVAAFALVRGTRLPLATGVCVAAAASWWLFGTNGLRAYVTHVLPDAARANVADPFNYGLAPLLREAGLSERAALGAGDVSYAVMLVAGSVLALRLLRRGERTAPAIIPPALVLIGGPYIHISQMAIALPALVWLMTRAPRAPTTAVASVALGVPWLEAAASSFLVVPATLAAGIVSRVRSQRDATTLATMTVVAVLTFGLSAIVQLRGAPPHHPQALPAMAPGESAEQAWGDEVRAHPLDVALFTAIKLPTWIGLLALAAGVWQAGSTDAEPRGALEQPRLQARDA